MVKRLKMENSCNFVTITLLMLILPGISGVEKWKLPTALDVQAALETCNTTNLLFLKQQDIGYKMTEEEVVEETDNGPVRCINTVLKLWSDEEGFIAKRFIKLLNKQHKPIEVAVVIDYCNRQHKQLNLNKWAEEAYYCFAKGRIGKWLSEYIKNVYKKKQFS